MKSYVKTACIAILFTNDLKHIHLHSAGEDFDKIHNLAEEYYDKMAEESDYLCELAIENGEPMVNPTRALEVVEEWQPEDEENYDYNHCLSAVNTKLTLYLRALTTLRHEEEQLDIQSKLDDIVRDWKKELEYKMAKRSQFATTSFVKSDVDDRTTEYAKQYMSQQQKGDGLLPWD